MAKNAWLAAPIAIVVLHRLAWGGGATTATTALIVLAVGTFALLFGLGMALRRFGVRSRAVGIVLAFLFWISAPNLSRPDWVGGTTIEPAPLALPAATEHRDLIVLMVDDQPSSRALLTDHGYDNAEFQLDLSERGFHEVPEAWSNSSNPVLAVASALSGRYPGTPRNERDRRRIAAIVEGDNPTADLLRDNGYTTTQLGAPSALSIWLGGPDAGDGSNLDEVADAIEAATGNDTPDFLFARIAECRAEAATSAALDDVVTQARCNNRLLVELLDRVDSGTRPPTDPVVVIAGTRGSNINGDLGDNPAAWPRSAIRRGLGVYAAVRLAPDCQPPPDDATVAVVVHHGVACSLGVQPDPPAEQAVVIKGSLVDPEALLDVNLPRLRSNLSGENSRTSK